MTTETRSKLAMYRYVTLVGMALDIALGVLKLLAGSIGHSQALVADGVHSLSDAFTDIFVLVVARISQSEPDKNHPYGHARFETLGTVALGGTLVAVALILAYSNILSYVRQESDVVPAWPTLLVAVVSVIGKEWIYRYTRKVGEQLRSNMLIANAWHSRSDAFSSIVVFVGIGGAILGVAWLDVLAAVIVAFIIAKIGIELVWNSLKELVDTGLDAEQTKAIKRTALQVEGVRNVHALRTRHMGTDIFLDMHIIVNPSVSVSEGHSIGEWVATLLLQQYPDVKDVTYHIDAEDDAETEPQEIDALLPLRPDVRTELAHRWQPLLDIARIEKLTLHYLGNKIHLELYLNAESYEQLTRETANATELLRKRCDDLVWLGSIRIWVAAS